MLSIIAAKTFPVFVGKCLDEHLHCSLLRVFQTSLRLEEIEVLLSGADPGSDQNALAERHTRLSQSIMEASIAALHVGRSLLGRVGRDDAAGDGVNKKV